METKEIKDWGVKETCEFLVKEGLQRWKDLFEEKKITGVDLQNPDRLKEIGIEQNDLETIINAFRKYLDKENPSKVLNDPIHGLIELHPLLIKIMDTPQFQRLRYIKQLGGAYFVYPGASHNRFEHSIGVAHLAGELAKALRSKQPELKIDDRDILCVQIAGLCHDLGHGPFSHLYDGIFIPRAGGKNWKHEDASLLMFDHLVDKNNLKPLMELYGLKPEENDLVFIKEMIQGKPLKTPEPQVEGRDQKKSFLYEIVANKQNGIDVDKFDYFARDAYHLGMQSNFDHKRFIKLARVCAVNGKKHICCRDKEVDNLYDMFHTRNYLHRRAYQHKTNKIIEIMISDALLKADEHIWIEGSGGHPFNLSMAKDDMEAYTKLTDQVFERILHPWVTSPELEEARQILERIVSRDLYKFVGETKVFRETFDRWKVKLTSNQNKTQANDPGVPPKQAEKPEVSQKEIDSLKVELVKDIFEKENQEDNFEVSIVTLDYGMKKKDPIKKTYFYGKLDPTKGFTIPEDQKSKLLPTSFSQTIMRVYCKNTQNITLNDARQRFKDWCSKNGFPVPQDGSRAMPEYLK